MIKISLIHIRIYPCSHHLMLNTIFTTRLLLFMLFLSILLIILLKVLLPLLTLLIIDQSIRTFDLLFLYLRFSLLTLVQI